MTEIENPMTQEHAKSAIGPLESNILSKPLCNPGIFLLEIIHSAMPQQRSHNVDEILDTLAQNS